ncbi:MAG: hypothetical protein N2Z69_04735 [Methylophilaceae bacterium]|nr:hypothetical protein [Methylophilaceae bacterium]
MHVLLTGVGRERVASLPRQPALEKMLAISSAFRETVVDAETWLCQSFGVDVSQGAPVAPYTALADGLDAGECHCLRVDPVCLQVRHEGVVLDGIVAGLAQEEADALVGALNRHFGADGPRFLAPHPRRWYMLLEDMPRLQAMSPARVEGKDVTFMLPRGEEVGWWRRWLNEVQMVLHEHPVNVERERRNLAPVNSVWPWGGGVLQRPLVAPYVEVWAADPLACGLALAAGVTTHPLGPLSLPSVEGDRLIVGEVGAVLDSALLPTVLQQLRTKDANAVQVHLGEARRVRSFTLKRTDLWKVWRKPRPLETYLHG